MTTNNKDPFFQNNSKQTKTPSANIPTKKVKKVKKVNLWNFLLWCVIFWIILFLLASLSIIFVIKNPNVFNIFWIPPSSLKSFLKIFSSIFFGFAILIWFILTIIWLIKTIKTKVWKGKYIFISIVGIFLNIFAISWLIISLIFINKISTWPIINSNQIAYYMVLNNEFLPSPVKNPNSLVAPSYFQFYLNKNLFQKQVANKFFNKLKDIRLDCGNNRQILNWWLALLKADNPKFEWVCFYTTKGSYTPSLIYSYINNDWEIIDEKIPLLPIKIISEIKLTVNWKTNQNFELNNPKVSIIWWPAPVDIKIDAQDFINNNDYLINENIYWDLNWDKKIDIENKIAFSYTFDKKWVYNITVYFPKYKLGYTIARIIVWPKSIDDCNISIKKIRNWTYKINLSINADQNLNKVEEIDFKITNTENWQNIYHYNKGIKTTFYKKLEPGKYKLSAIVSFDNWKKSKCQKIFEVDTTQIKWELSIYQTNIDDIQFFQKEKIKQVWLDNETIDIKIDKIPSFLMIKVENIIPWWIWEYEFNLKDQYWKTIKQIEKWVFTYKISSYKQQILYLYINNNKISKKYEIKIIPSGKKAIAILTAEPTSWFEPLTVQFDATQSKSELNDEIVYFSWDFWDWKTILNTSQWKITHTYTYDYQNENGIYIAKVKITTANWYTDTASVRINVKKAPKQIKILSWSHPSQIAKVGDSITFKIQADGGIKKIWWDFGNWDSYSCDYRACDSISITYDNPGKYIVKAKVEFEDWTIASDSLTIQVK